MTDTKKAGASPLPDRLESMTVFRVADALPRDTFAHLLEQLPPTLRRSDPGRAEAFVLEAHADARIAANHPFVAGSSPFAIKPAQRELIRRLADDLHKVREGLAALDRQSRWLLGPDNGSANLYLLAGRLEAALRDAASAFNARTRDDEERARAAARAIVWRFQSTFGKLPPSNAASWFIGFAADLGACVGLACGPRIARDAVLQARAHP